MTRVAYARQIQELRDAVVSLASMVDKAIARSVDALKLQDIQLARDVVRADADINRQRWQTEECALLVIATQAPMAGDLRTISAVIHIVTELERMAREMLADSITAFIQEDAEAARAIVDRDDEVDDLYNQIYRELLTYMMADPTTINRATHLLRAAHNLERIADRVTNICERVVFAVTGTLEEMAVSTY
jgi:phosphate transport system protein